jgi:hypothetical protein
MSHPVNDSVIEKLGELRDLVNFLESELLFHSLQGNYDYADQTYGELIDARKELAKFEDWLGITPSMGV